MAEIERKVYGETISFEGLPGRHADNEGDIVPTSKEAWIEVRREVNLFTIEATSQVQMTRGQFETWLANIKRLVEDS